MIGKAFFPLLFTWAATAYGQAARPSATAVVLGVATDTAGGPLRGVEVLIAGDRWRAVTDDSGRFRFDGVEVGRHQVTARRIGLAPESLFAVIRSVDPEFLRIQMREGSSQLGEVLVNDSYLVPGRLQGFEYRRARRNNGQFVTREDIERTSPINPTDLIRRMQGVRIIDSMGVALAISTRGPKIQMVSGRPIPVQCVVRVGLDGTLREPYFPMNTIAMTDIYGIEVYAGAASLPTEFSGARKDAACGLIMIWTRSR